MEMAKKSRVPEHRLKVLTNIRMSRVNYEKLLAIAEALDVSQTRAMEMLVENAKFGKMRIEPFPAMDFESDNVQTSLG